MNGLKTKADISYRDKNKDKIRLQYNSQFLMQPGPTA
jgi:hypothetical protein